MLLAPPSAPPNIPGVAGVVRDGILPGFYGFETGQAAMGDAFDFVRRLTGGQYPGLGAPLLFDDSYAAKPAVQGLIEVLERPVTLRKGLKQKVGRQNPVLLKNLFGVDAQGRKTRATQTLPTLIIK
jgi:ribulose kinase